MYINIYIYYIIYIYIYIYTYICIYIHMGKRRGPIIDPCGTPLHCIRVEVENAFL